MILLLEQVLNGIQLGLLLFLLAAGLTLVFGIMDFVNLAHGSLYMMGAYFAVTFIGLTDSFLLGVLLALPAALLLGIVVELVCLRTLYPREHLDQVLATFGLILFFNDAVQLIWGAAGRTITLPSWLQASIEILPGVPYPAYRFSVIVIGLLVAGGLFLLISRTRIGMLIRAGASNREMVGALGVDIKLLYTLVFGLGAMLAALAGIMAAPILTVQIGMGERIIIQTFVVVVIGGIGSVRGTFIAALLIGLLETFGGAFLPELFKMLLPAAYASTTGAAAASMLTYVLMAAVLALKPEGLFPARSG